MAINMYLLIMTLNVNGINAPIKKQSELNWMKKKKQEATICCLQEIHFKTKDTHRLKVKRDRKWYFVYTERTRKQGIILEHQTK